MISAKVVADSIANGIRLTTLELQFHRFILPEFNTHRMFSRNASSSRAIPIEKMIKQVETNPAMPIHWGKNQSGMQARQEVLDVDTVKGMWLSARDQAVDMAEWLMEENIHKQVANRITEPFQWIKVIVTATEWDNFFKLRDHPDAQPEIQELARCMKQSIACSEPTPLVAGEWHLPYVTGDTWEDTKEDLSKAIKCSVARCARVSYNNHDNSAPDIEKDIILADRLLEAGHMSPFEHQATPMEAVQWDDYTRWEKGITHMDRKTNFWSGNFRGWVQYRQLL